MADLTISWVTPVLFLIGFLVSTYSSVVGGGALILVPFFTLIGQSVPAAIGTMRLSSLFQQPVCIAAFQKRGKLDWRMGLWAGLWSMPGGYLGARLVLALDERFVTAVVVVIMILLLLCSPHFKHATSGKRKKLPMRWFLLALISLFLGVYGGFYGAGFSTILMVLFFWLGGLDIIAASGTASLATFLMAITASYPFLQAGIVDWSLLVPLTAGGVLGSWFGVGWAVKYGWRWVHSLLIVLVVASSLKLILLL